MEAESYLLEEYKNLIQRKELCRQNFGKLHLENRQHHFSSSCSGTAHSLVWVSVSGLSSPSLSLLFPPPSPKMLHLPCSLTGELLSLLTGMYLLPAAPHGHSNELGLHLSVSQLLQSLASPIP